MSTIMIREIEDPLAGVDGSRGEIIAARREWIAGYSSMLGRREPLRVLIGSNTLTCGGAEHQILRLMPRLLELGIEAEHFYHGGPHHLGPRFEESGLTSHFRDLHALGRRRFLAETATLFRTRRYDVAHAFVGTANLYTRWAAKRAGVPVILGGWRKSRPEKSLPLWLLYSYIDRWSSAWIVNSRPSAEVLRTLCGRRSIEAYIVPNAFEFGENRRTGPDPLPGEIAEWIGGRRSVAILGRAESSKNYDLFIDVAASVTAKNSDACFVLIASTDHTAESEALERRLRARISDEGLSGSVLYTGRLDGAASLLGNFSLFLFTSEHEGCPNAVIEAMAAGLPIVMTRCTDTGLLVDEGMNGFTCSGSVEELSRRVESILSDDESRRRFGERSRDLAQSFDAADSAWALARIYLEEWHQARGST